MVVVRCDFREIYHGVVDVGFFENSSVIKHRRGKKPEYKWGFRKIVELNDGFPLLCLIAGGYLDPQILLQILVKSLNNWW